MLLGMPALSQVRHDIVYFISTCKLLLLCHLEVKIQQKVLDELSLQSCFRRTVRLSALRAEFFTCC